MDRDRLLTAGLWLLAPAAALFTLRALLALADQPYPAWLGPLTGVGGALSLVGLVLAVVGAWATPRRALVVAGVAIAVVGHYLFTLLPGDLPLLGPAMTYVGTGVVAMSVRRLAVVAGAVAGLGVVLRDMGGAEPAGHALVAVGAAGLCVLLVLAGRDLERP